MGYDSQGGGGNIKTKKECCWTQSAQTVVHLSDILGFEFIYDKTAM